MKTDQLIDELARDLPAAPPLSPPWIRTGRWLLGAGAYMAVLTLLMTSSADLSANGTGWRFLAPQVAAIAMATTAMLAAFSTTVPGEPSRLKAVAAAAALWVATLFASVSPAGSGPGVVIANPEEWSCIVWTVVGGALPATGALVMLRRGALLTPPLTTALAVVAVAALANVSACISDPHPDNLGVLVWHGGTMVVLALLAAWATPLFWPMDVPRRRS